MTDNIPKVSVVITCHNLGRYLREAVDSVYRQSLQDFEIIVVDDSSDDKETVDLLAHLNTPKVRVMHVEGRNVSAARNCGIRESRGKYTCCLDADDALEPTYLEKAVIILDKDPTIGFVGCWYEAFGEEQWTFKPEGASLADFLVENHAPIMSLFRREVWDKVGGYDERLEGYEDWEFWINILAHGYGYRVLKEILFKYRVRNYSKIKESNLPENREKIMAMILEKHRDIFKDNAVSVFFGKEKLIGELLDWTRQQDVAKRWLLQRDAEHEKCVEKFKRDIAWHVEQIGNHRRDIEQLKGEIACQRDLISHLKHTIHRNELEIQSVYASKVWKLGCAFRDAKHSLRAFLLLPFRFADFACPNSVKRGIKKLFLIEPHEAIKKNIHKFPYRLADRLAPDALKKALPYRFRNAVRALFRSTDERLYEQVKWDGPLITVVIPCYNYGSYLDEALQSVRNQTFTNHEIIIVDDGSTDPLTINKLEEIENREIPGVRIIHQANAGVSHARNHGIAEARGKYICCLDADDCLEPRYFEKSLKILESGNLDVCYSYFQVFGDEEWIAKPGRFDIEVLKTRNCACVAAVFKKSIWEKVGGYNPNMKGGYEDWDFWISVAEQGAQGAVIPEPLFRYRRHGRTMLVDAEEKHNLLYAQIRKNHPRLFSKNRYIKRKITYRVINPDVNIYAVPMSCKET